MISRHHFGLWYFLELGTLLLLETGRAEAISSQLLFGLCMTTTLLDLLLTGVDLRDLLFDDGLEVVDDFKVLFE